MPKPTEHQEDDEAPDERAAGDLDTSIAALRRFMRFYASHIGVLQEGLLGSDLSLPESRIITELAQSGERGAAVLGRDLSIDGGYLSRTLRMLEGRGLVTRRLSPTDGRQSLMSLTEAGHKEVEVIDARAQAQVGSMVRHLDTTQHCQLVEGLGRVEELLGGRRRVSWDMVFILRPPRAGDMGWVTHRNAVLYARDYGWNEQFEVMVAQITANFVSAFNPERERCWIAERAGAIVGSIFLLRVSDDIAQLRLLYVEPDVRRLGIGRQLVDECLAFACQAGYAKVVLWTNDVLIEARRIFLAVGFRIVAEEHHHSFGQDLVGQNWELNLYGGGPVVAPHPQHVRFRNTYPG